MGQGTWPVVAAAAFVGFLVGILWLAVLGRIAAGALVVTVHVLAGALLALSLVTDTMAPVEDSQSNTDLVATSRYFGVWLVPML